MSKHNVPLLIIKCKNIFLQERTTIYIILLHKVDIESKIEVEFSSEHGAPQHVLATIVNEYTLSAIAPGRWPIYK